MKPAITSCITWALAACAAMAAVSVEAQSQASQESAAATSSASAEGGVPLAQLIATVAKKTGKKFVVDPRVRADVMLIGQSPSAVSYADLLTILQVHGFAAVESGGYVQVLPDASMRTLPVPLVNAKENRPDAESVSRVIPVHNMPAAHLVPILRPLLPQRAHLAANICSNSLIMVDSFANVRRIEAIVQALDVGQPYKVEHCEAQVLVPGTVPPPPPPREASPPQR
jgi:general secretion pathway protein D